jgi:hypothetical protein
VATLTDVYLRARRDPQWESVHISKRPLRGPQAEMITKIEKFVTAHKGGVMTILSSRQTGKNEMGAILQRRHLWRRQFANLPSIWIRTAPTYKPQIVNSKKRLREILLLDAKKRIRHPLFSGQKLIQEEGYIWRLGNASVEFVSSGPQANVVGATASECLDMDEAHKVDKAKFDEDFAPFTASTNAATLLWGVAANGLDTIEAYRQLNIEKGRTDLNIRVPCEDWMEHLPKYRAHVEERVAMLGWDHPIIKTQYRLIPVSAEGKFLQPNHIRNLFEGDHERQNQPRPGSRYEAVIDIAAGNEDFNPDADLEGEDNTATDSTIIWIYEVSPLVASNGVFPIIRLVNLVWITGAPLEVSEEEIKQTLEFWRIEKATIDGVGVGRQIGESMERLFGPHMIVKYLANSTSVSEDCFDLQARLNFKSVRMFRNDGSPEWAEFERQCGWTLYSSDGGKMKLSKPGAKKHIDMVKALTYINRNSPIAGMHELYKIEGDYV